jgi:hypothetical protein
MFSPNFLGDFAPSQIITSWVKSTFKLPAELQRSIESAWKKASRVRGHSLFDGPMCRLESWKVEGTRLRLQFSRISYKWFWGTNLMRHDLPKPLLANAIGLSAALESSDGYLLFGRRNSRVAYHPNRIHPFAGSAVDRDVFAEMRRELAEELKLTDADIADIRCIGMAEDKVIRQPELVFLVRSTRTRAEIRRRLDTTEHNAIWTVPTKGNAISRAMSNKKLTPIAVETLCLWMANESSSLAHLRRAIARAEKLLPGKPVKKGSDPRWQAMLKIEHFILSHPEPIWEFALRWGSHPDADLRTAVATVLLEHLLEDHFESLFPRVRDAARTSRRFKDTLGRCWWMGEAAWPSSAKSLDQVAGVKRARLSPRRPASLPKMK